MAKLVARNMMACHSGDARAAARDLWFSLALHLHQLLHTSYTGWGGASRWTQQERHPGQRIVGGMRRGGKSLCALFVSRGL